MTNKTSWPNRILGAAIPLLFTLLTGCGDGGNDTVLSGFSGVLIFGIGAYVVYRIVKNKT